MKPFISPRGDLYLRVHRFIYAALIFILPALVFTLDIGMNWALAHEGSHWSGMSASDLALFGFLNLIALAFLVGLLWFTELRTTLVFSEESVSVTHRTALRSSSVTYPLDEIRLVGFSRWRANRSFFPDTHIKLNLVAGGSVDAMTLPFPFQERRAHAALLDFLTARGKAHLLSEPPTGDGRRF